MPFVSLDPLRIGMLLFSLVAALTVHEASHAGMAVYLGDSTPRSMGRLTLNPLAHLDPLGTLMMIYTVIMGFGLGWAKPVPVNPYRLRVSPQTGMALVSLAGPGANLLSAGVFSVVLGLALGLGNPHAAGTGAYYAILQSLLGSLITINVVIAIFNLIPIPPLDGFHALLGILPRASANTLARLEPYGPFMLLALIFFGAGVLQTIFGVFSHPILDVLNNIVRATRQMVS